jgi:cob(I)alamin adenosyltransferase
MKYYSGIGDKGYTFTFEKKHKKSEPIVNAIGTLDELSAFLGLAESACTYEEIKGLLKNIELAVYTISSEVAYEAAGKLALKRLAESDVSFLEGKTDDYGKFIKDIKRFVYPNGSISSTSINVCRAVARRAEREAVAAGIKNDVVLKYLNRLSSLLFVLFRYVNEKEKNEEDFF